MHFTKSTRRLATPAEARADSVEPVGAPRPQASGSEAPNRRGHGMIHAIPAPARTGTRTFQLHALAREDRSNREENRVDRVPPRTTPKAAQLLTHARSLGVVLWSQGDRLHYRGLTEAVTPALVADLRYFKPDLLDLLEAETERQAIHLEGCGASVDTFEPLAEAVFPGAVVEGAAPGRVGATWRPVGRPQGIFEFSAGGALCAPPRTPGGCQGAGKPPG